MNRNWSNQRPNPALKTQTEINITNRQKTMRTNGQPSGQLFPKRWPLSNPNRTKSIMNKHKVKHHRNSDTKTGNRDHIRTIALALDLHFDYKRVIFPKLATELWPLIDIRMDFAQYLEN